MSAYEKARTAREQLASLRLTVRQLRRALAAASPPVVEEETEGFTATTQGEGLATSSDPFQDVLDGLVDRIDDLADALTVFVDHLRADVLKRRPGDSASRRAASIVRGQELTDPVLSCLGALRTVASGLRGYLGR